MRTSPFWVAALLLGGAATASSRASGAPPGPPSNRRVPFRRTVPMAAPLAPASTPALVYYGGPVLSAVDVVQVIWGTGTYLGGITGGGTTTATKLGDFYHAVTASAYIDWLCEYNTPTQAIGRGVFARTITIAPAAANDGALITDSEIQSELIAQIGAGALPAPTSNTVYMIDFPLGKTIDDGTGSRSCIDLCGYHSTGILSGQYFYYSVLPDFSPGSGCETGCGNDPVTFNNVTSVASHELIEAVTDAAVGQATVNGPPLAWYDVLNGEIGDICNQLQSSFVGSDGVTYVVQDLWSNAATACIAQKPNHPPVAQCQSVTVPVFGCSAPASIDNGSHDPDCWDVLHESQSPPGPYPVGTTMVTLTVTDNSGAFSACSANVVVTSTGCDDGIACTTGDACSGSVCSGTPGPPPPETDNGVRVSRSGAVATMTWDLAAGATVSDVLRGRISALPVGPGGADEICLADNSTATSATDGGLPPVGDGFWYVVRGESPCGIGTYGFQTQSATPTVERKSTTCP